MKNWVFPSLRRTDFLRMVVFPIERNYLFETDILLNRPISKQIKGANEDNPILRLRWIIFLIQFIWFITHLRWKISIWCQNDWQYHTLVHIKLRVSQFLFLFKCTCLNSYIPVFFSYPNCTCNLTFRNFLLSQQKR